MANLVMNDKALARLQESDMRMGRYYLPNDALMQFFQSLKLCVEAIGPMPRRIRAGLQCGGASTHSSVKRVFSLAVAAHRAGSLRETLTATGRLKILLY